MKEVRETLLFKFDFCPSVKSTVVNLIVSTENKLSDYYADYLDFDVETEEFLIYLC